MRRSRRPAAFCAALVLACSGACECSEGGGIARVVPEIEVSPASLDFGEVPFGSTKRLELVVRNTGTADLTLGSADATQPFAAELLQRTIAPGASAAIDVAFAPQAEGEQSGTLLVSSDANTRPMLSVSLRGTAVAGVVEVAPARIDFSSTTVGGARSAELVVTHRGLEPLSGQIQPERFLRPEHFALTGLTGFEPGPFGVPARGESRFDLEYRPLVTGEDGGRLVFEICGPRCGPEVEVVASAVSAAIRLDPAVVDFGATGIGSSKTSAVTVYNEGTTAIEVLGAATIGGPELTSASARPLPQTLEPGSSLAIDLIYAPTSAAELEGELIVRSTDRGVPEAKVRVRGSGAGPLFQVQPDQLDFGVQRTVADHRRAFLLLNSGSAEVRIESITLTGDPSFSLERVPGLPARVGSGESLAPYVRWRPSGSLGEYFATVEVRTDDPASAVVQIPVRAGFADQICELEVEPARVNFGLLRPGRRRVRNVTLGNRGVDPCTITAGAFRAPTDPAMQLLTGTFPLVLAPNDSATLAFVYAPSTEVESKVIFVLTTDDPVFPERLVSLVGSARGYEDLFVLPDELDFGELRPGCAARNRQVTVFNGGLLDAVVDSTALTSSTSELVLRPHGTPVTIAPGNSWTLGLDYVPDDLGTDSGELVIVVRDRPYPFVVPLTGTGSPFQRITENFRQVENRAVDVLFVVDDSCSMDDEQALLARNFDAFIRTANLRQVDFRIGVTTTSVELGTGGDFEGPLLRPGTNNLEGEFASQVSVGIFGSGFEQGLEAMLLALHKAGGPGARQFLRQVATLVVIIVSDEDDSSPAPALTYFNELRTLARNGFLTAVVGGQLNGCVQANGGQAFPSPKYDEFVTLTGGISLSICGDWATSLATLGSAAFGLQTRFVLGTPVDVNDPIEVRVNGVPVPASSWTYDPGSNSINFREGSVPPENATIEVTYTPFC